MYRCYCQNCRILNGIRSFEFIAIEAFTRRRVIEIVVFEPLCDLIYTHITMSVMTEL